MAPEEAKVRDGAWHHHSRAQITFAEYVETVWLPSEQVETSTLAAYRSYLDKHFLPTFAKRPMGKILPTAIQRWVPPPAPPRKGKGNGLPPCRCGSTTPCCIRSSNAPCATVWSASTPAPTLSSPRSSRRRPGR